jgi:hypothetical protein
MFEAFKQLVESGIMTEETKTVVETAFSSKLQEQREQVTAELREEFAQKYKHDKSVMVEAIDRMINDRLTLEMAELAEDKQSLIEAKIAYRKKMKSDAKMLESFIVDQLSKELVEFQGDRNKVSQNFAKLEEFVVHALAKEISEFAQDKQDLVEAKVKLVREAKSKLAEMKSQFIKRNTRIVESAVTKMLTSELKQLHEDISHARNNDFGRRLYEAFAQEFSTSHFSEKSETNKLLRIIQQKDQALQESTQRLSKTQKLIESKERELRIAKDVAQRKAMLGELLAPLSGDQRDLMRNLLESVATSKLSNAFDKYLPTVMEGQNKKAVKKTALTESTAVTGNRESKPVYAFGDDNILDIRKLAGLK